MCSVRVLVFLLFHLQTPFSSRYPIPLCFVYFSCISHQYCLSFRHSPCLILVSSAKRMLLMSICYINRTLCFCGLSSLELTVLFFKHFYSYLYIHLSFSQRICVLFSTSLSAQSYAHILSYYLHFCFHILHPSYMYMLYIYYYLCMYLDYNY